MITKKSIMRHICLISALLFFCKFPYEPINEPPVIVAPADTSITTDIIVNKIAPGSQICNPSISQDTTNFPGCMLWLNFSGSLPVKTDSSTRDYSVTGALQHDRLTITDNSNTVRWFMMKDLFSPDPDIQFQDPEWSAHPEYIGSLIGDADIADSWSFLAIHPITSHYLKIIDKRLYETSTPHLWVDQSASHPQHVNSDITYDKNGLVNVEAIQEFFGTTKVKIVYSVKENDRLKLYYVDFSSHPVVPIRLQQPLGDDKKNWFFESALISPDGEWTVYNGWPSSTQYSVFIQKLTSQSNPILLKEGASDPHWWVNPQSHQLFVLYNIISGDNR
ncbi:MAG TPA: hypothetical protein VHO70_02455, partial [Chitinispirillaceae bacterium]|nr:hypothetical protein [Chitinispirillaceae bacterium]